MSKHFQELKSSGGRLKVKLDLSNYAKKADLKNDETNNLSNLKSKVDKLVVDKLVPVPADLSKLNDVVKNDVVKKGVYNAKMKNVEEKTTDSC